MKRKKFWLSALIGYSLLSWLVLKPLFGYSIIKFLKHKGVNIDNCIRIGLFILLLGISGYILIKALKLKYIESQNQKSLLGLITNCPICEEKLNKCIFDFFAMKYVKTCYNNKCINFLKKITIENL